MALPLRELPVRELPSELRPPSREGQEAHFGPTDVHLDISRAPMVRRFLKSRPFQFMLILPNQIIFWLVIVTGLVGIVSPTRNFATVITWYIWFCAVFLLMVGIGRGWCAMCPFGGLGEWVQRHTLWKRHAIPIGLNLRWPQALTKWALLPSVVMFLGLTWFEEHFNIAAPGDPRFTSFLVFFVIGSALLTFLIFERRTFCRYLCPLTALIGTVGSTGMVAGMRTRDRERCITCPTKDCMRGSERGYPCPWYEWPGSATSNLMCGLCTECIKNCPYDNVGIFLQKPLTSVIAPVRRRVDVAWGVAILFGLVIFQQVNALPFYAPLDRWLNRTTGFPGYPNPLDYLGVIAVVALLVGAYAWVARELLAKRSVALVRSIRRAPGRAGSFASWFAPLAYGFIPLMASDYLSRQLPRLWYHGARIIPALSDPFGFGWNLFGTAHSSLYSFQILSPRGVVISQVIVTVIGTLGAAYATWRIAGRDLKPLTGHLGRLRAVSVAAVGLCGLSVAVLYVAMGGAS